MKEYLMRLICAAIVCAVVRAMTGQQRGIRDLICGVFLILTALSVPVGMELPALDPEQIEKAAQGAVRDGAAQAEAARETFITEAIEAYIWNKAAGLDLQLTVQVELTEDRMPKAVVLTGLAPDALRQQLTRELVRELGLGEEDVTWKQPQESSA